MSLLLISAEATWGQFINILFGIWRKHSFIKKGVLGPPIDIKAGDGNGVEKYRTAGCRLAKREGWKK